MMHSIENECRSESRREFMKKSLYRAPTLVALGALVRPTLAEAETSIPDPPFGLSQDSTTRSRSNDPFKSQFD